MTESQNITSKDIGGGSGSSNPSPRSQPPATGSGGTPADRATNPSSNAESGSPPLIGPSTGTDQNVTDTQSALGYQHHASAAVHGTQGASPLSFDPQPGASNSRRVTTETATESLPDFVDANATTRPSQIHGARSSNAHSDDTMSELSAATKFTALSQSNENQSAIDSLKNTFSKLDAALATLTDQYTYPNEDNKDAAADAGAADQ